MDSAAWAGSIKEFLATPKPVLLRTLADHSQTTLGEAPSQAQRRAWESSADILRKSILDATTKNPSIQDWNIIWEFELPRERGRRPDVLILGPGRVLVLEFKEYADVKHAHLDQVSGYARDLQNHHAGSRHLNIHPVLVPAQSKGFKLSHDSVQVLSPDSLYVLWDNPPEDSKIPEPSTWLAAEYDPLPDIVSAARRLFNHEPLPQINRVRSAGIPEALHTIRQCAASSREKHQHHLILVTGVPGSGKTLLGLEFVYGQHLGRGEEERSAVFLSGNGPLVKVLQHALQSKVFVQDVHGFLRAYGGNSHRIPLEHIWVYDEAQRAWDAERVRQRRGHPTSEPKDFLCIGEKKPWAAMVGLIGDGQEIHLGEEAGLKQWNDALAESNSDWFVTCPTRLRDLFSNATAVTTSDALDLTKSLRTHEAEQSFSWVSLLLNGDLEGAARVAETLQKQYFSLYLTRNLRSAKLYAINLYGEAKDRRYGLIASSKASDLPNYGIPNQFKDTKQVKLGPWYNAPPDSPDSCCKLSSVATEFSCQGLELDLAIVAWGNDLWWRNGRWHTQPPGPNSTARDYRQLRINSYRVLLTRGRDGLVIFLPPDEGYDATADALLRAGVREIGPIRS